MVVERRVINIPGQKRNALDILGFRDDVGLMSTVPAKAGWIEAMARHAGVFELPFEQDVPGSFSQSGENLSRTRDELMELERQECACPRTAPLSFREADAGQEGLKATSADFTVDAAVI